MRSKRSLYGILVLGLMVFFTGCGKDDNPVEPEDHDKHAEAVGCVVMQEDMELARAEKGTVSGELVVQALTETPVLNLYLVAEDGDLFQPEEDEYTMAWDSQDPSIADLIQYQADGKWGFRLKGLDVGNTSISFVVMHGDHEDFVSLAIPVKVEPNGGGGL
mgnify:CR=1 FL=1